MTLICKHSLQARDGQSGAMNMDINIIQEVQYLANYCKTYILTPRHVV